MGIVTSIRSEFLRYRDLGDKAIAQLDNAGLTAAAPGGGNSIATICWHMSGNFRSRFTEFLTSDGEKPWRKRDEEFEPRSVTRAELRQKWDAGWNVLLGALDTLTDDDLGRTVTIRGQGLSVQDALLRSLAHASYHVGQIVYAAKAAQGADWKYLSIPPGKSEKYNRAATLEKPPR
ncbi:MAG TPA: DinB family protein [Vicinamibacterales bacterium]|nr:DinB family protein [Vicinamibacterales bacterium]